MEFYEFEVILFAHSIPGKNIALSTSLNFKSDRKYFNLDLFVFSVKICSTYQKAKVSTMNVMERTFSIINSIPASTFLRLYLDDIMYPISYHA